MNTKTSLSERLNDIQKSVSETNRVYKSYQQRMRGDVVSAYLWWKDAIQDTDYLDALLLEEDIKNTPPNNSNSVNFTPIVQLVFQKYDLNEGNTANEVYDKRKALEAVHAYYEEKAEYLARRDNVHNELLNWINDNGGIRGIKFKHTQKLQESGFGDENDEQNFNFKSSTTNEKTLKAPSPKTQQKKQQQKLGTVAVQRKQAIAYKSDTAVDIGEVSTDEDELVVMLAKRNADGKITFIGDTTDEQFINRALELCTSLDLTSKNKILRIIIESLQPHYVPKVMHDKKLRGKFFTKSTTKRQLSTFDKAERLTESVRLILTQDNKVIVSKSPTSTSLLTVSEAKFDMEIDWDLFLRANDRHYLEVEGEHNKALATVDSDEQEHLSETASHIKAHRQLTLLNSVTKSVRNIYFYDTDLLNHQMLNQPTCDANIEDCFSWKATVTKKFIQKLNSQHFKQWIAKVNKRIAIKEQKHFEIVVDKDGIEVRSYFNLNEQEYTNEGNNYFTNWESKSDIQLRKKSNVHHHRVLTLDTVQLFEVLSNLRTVNKLTIYGYEGNEYGGCIALKYETDVATYTTYVPHCEISGKRQDCDLFVNYEAN
jgi:hypothetical protein